MRNDVHEPPLEPEYAERLKQHPKATAAGKPLQHPVLSVDEPIADVELYGRRVPDRTFVGGLAFAAAALVLLLILAAVLWAWMR